MAKQKVYVQESYVYEYEVPAGMDAEEIEEFIKRMHPTQKDTGCSSVQYMTEDSEWVEIHGIQ